MRALLFVIGLACLIPTSYAAEGGWIVGLEQARTAATAKKLPILIDFTGSDWCGWCMKLKEEVFDTPEFKTWAAKSVILMEADFPQSKKLPAKQEAENDALAKKYSVGGYPTIMLINPDGSVIGQLGYQEGGPKAWIASAEKILSGKPAK